MHNTQRLESIDQFRGLAILLMVLANYASDVEKIPAWLKHAPDIGLTAIDLVAPLFIFAIGLTFWISTRSRIARQGISATYGHFFRRSMALVGIGCIISSGEILLGQNPGGINWGVLQAIGVAILITLPSLSLPSFPRLIAGLTLLAIYQFLLDQYWLEATLQAPHGGLTGSLGWTAMLIIATVLADIFHKQSNGRIKLLLAALLVLAVGICLLRYIPISKSRVSTSYVLVSLGISGVLFATVAWIADRWKKSIPILTVWGRNPLILYGIHYLLLGMIVLPNIPCWYVEAPLWLVGIQAIVLVGILTWIGVFLDRKGWLFTI